MFPKNSSFVKSEKTPDTGRLQEAYPIASIPADVAAIPRSDLEDIIHDVEDLRERVYSDFFREARVYGPAVMDNEFGQLIDRLSSYFRG